MYDAVTTNHEIRNLDPEPDEEEEAEEGGDPEASAVPDVVVEQSNEQTMPINPTDAYQPFSFDPNVMAGFDPMEFQLPNDLWAMKIWGVF